MSAPLDPSQVASLFIMLLAAFGLPMWGWMRVLAAYRVQEARRRAYEQEKELRRQHIEAQVAAMQRSILKSHGFADEPDTTANP
jgi:hypothetical protein